MKFDSRLIRFAQTFLVVALSSAAQAADPGDMEGLVRTYWSHLARSDYRGAAETICGDDLAVLKSQVLPVLLDESRSTDPDARAFAESFFADTPPDRRPDMSGKDVYARFGALVMENDPNYGQLKRGAIRKLTFDAVDATHTKVAYEMLVGTTRFGNADIVRTTADGLCLVLQSRPADLAATLKSQFPADKKAP
jgi:hypothetical protein